MNHLHLRGDESLLALATVGGLLGAALPLACQLICTVVAVVGCVHTILRDRRDAARRVRGPKEPPCPCPGKPRSPC